MALHERSIRGCGAAGGAATLYLHLFAWPLRHVRLPGLAGRVEYAQLLHVASEVAMRETDGGGLTLDLPAIAPPVLIPVVELFLRG